MAEVFLYSDEELAMGLHHGDEACFTQIYNRYWEELYSKTEALLADSKLAEDCVQEVFLRIWRTRQEVVIQHLSAYLRKAVRFQALWMIRNQKVGQACYQRIATVSTELVLHEPLLFKELDALFQDVLRTLPADAREIFNLAREEKLSYKEIAERKGISVKTVEKKMSLSLKELRLKLGDLLHLFF